MFPHTCTYTYMYVYQYILNYLKFVITYYYLRAVAKHKKYTLGYSHVHSRDHINKVFRYM